MCSQLSYNLKFQGMQTVPSDRIEKYVVMWTFRLLNFKSVLRRRCKQSIISSGVMLSSLSRLWVSSCTTQALWRSRSIYLFLQDKCSLSRTTQSNLFTLLLVRHLTNCRFTQIFRDEIDKQKAGTGRWSNELPRWRHHEWTRFRFHDKLIVS